jgi:ribosomal protein S27E
MTPGTNAGTGQPLTFRCAKCKVGRRWYESSEDRVGCNVEATGKTRGKIRERHWGRMLSYYVQYRCLDCGHVGWSRHHTMEGLLKRRAI